MCTFIWETFRFLKKGEEDGRGGLFFIQAPFFSLEPYFGYGCAVGDLPYPFLPPPVSLSVQQNDSLACKKDICQTISQKNKEILLSPENWRDK